jgi:hypothetical protein
VNWTGLTGCFDVSIEFEEFLFGCWWKDWLGGFDCGLERIKARFWCFKDWRYMTFKEIIMELFDQLMHNWLLSSWVFYILQGKLAWSWSILLSEILKVNSWAVIHFVSFLCNWSFRSRKDQSLRPQALVRELSALPCKESLDKLKLDSSRKLLWVVEIGIFTVLWLCVLYLAAYRCSSWLNRTWGNCSM